MVDNRENGPEDGDAAVDDRCGEPDLPLDAVLGLLSHPRRRYVLLFFIDQFSEVATVADLGEFVYRWESEAGQPPDPERLRRTLRRTHLPALADAGVIDYDDADGSVRYLGSERLERVHSRVKRKLNS